MRFCSGLHPELQGLMSILCDVINLARDIYIQRVKFDPLPGTTDYQIEQFKQLVERTDAHGETVGHHLLAWSYFIVAAESSRPDHRIFFLNRLEKLHETTKCGNIRKAILQISTIWAVQGQIRWTSLLGGPTQALIM